MTIPGQPTPAPEDYMCYWLHPKQVPVEIPACPHVTDTDTVTIDSELVLTNYYRADSLDAYCLAMAKAMDVEAPASLVEKHPYGWTAVAYFIKGKYKYRMDYRGSKKPTLAILQDRIKIELPRVAQYIKGVIDV